MRITVTQLAASRTIMACESLIAAAASTATDRLNWVPMANAREVMDQLRECIVANRKWTEILKTRKYANLGPTVWEQVEAECTTLDKVTEKLKESAAALVTAIEAIPDDETADTIETEWGLYSLADCCLHAYWNMTYHEGQINYIQTLYGDEDEHY